jgi:hypothetical protein
MLSEQRMISWKKKVLGLAKTYGTSVRFYPDGNEDDSVDAGVDLLDETIEDGEKAELKGNKEWDKERQRADQEAANARKARDLASQVQSELETTRSEAEQLRTELAKAKSEAAKAGIEDVELKEEEYDGSDLTLVKAIKSIKKEIAAKDAEIKNLQEANKKTEQATQQDKAAQRRNADYEELLSALDSEFDADCRNEAVTKFNDLVAAGNVPKGNPAKATLIMAKCYKEIYAVKHKGGKSNKTGLALDTGSGGNAGIRLSGSKLKKGSLDEVAAQAAKMSIKT